ncbi:hypothetical protein TRIUR3_30247 [Triticum urartu]|uniref:Uncharacterized protein n=1 Tax=Triticum urartu TaxID=4572 RepID=M7ZTN3_TRIUA|nr:hypothetical protein TRIUR3_30247 [Triticum urartu]
MVWRLGKRCDAVEGLVGSAGATVQAVRVRGVVCTVCGSGTKARALNKGSSAHTVERPRSGSCSDKPVSRSLAFELEQEANTEDEDIESEVNGAEEGNVERLRRRLVRERRLKEAALEELEKERRAAASAADEAMAKIACLRNEKALVEREAKQFREMVQQKQMYDRQMLNAICGTLSSLIIVNSIDVCSLLVHDVGFLNAKIFQFRVSPSFGIPQKAFTGFDCVDLQATFAFSLDFFMIRLNLKTGRVQLFPFFYFIVLASTAV